MAKSRIFVKHADVLVTMDSNRTELRDGALYVEDNVIKAVGTTQELENSLHSALSDTSLGHVQVIDATGAVLLPGLINCHTHMFQNLTRTVASGDGLGLIPWLQKLYPIWAEIDREGVYYAAKLGLCEMALSGATTVSDNLYHFGNGVQQEDTIIPAREIGVRFHPARGAISISGFAPEKMCQSEDKILEDCERLLKNFHDPSEFSMLRINIGPVIIQSTSPEFFTRCAELAQRYDKCMLHTHLAESGGEEKLVMDQFGVRPLEYVESLGWKGGNVWYAHGIHFNEEDIKHLADTNIGVAHCPTSNCILGAGICEARCMIENGVKLGLGTDGGAANGGPHLLGEARMAMLLQRVHRQNAAFSARQALELATRGGAAALNRPDIGTLEVGKAADFAIFQVSGHQHAGGQVDPVQSLLTCWPTQAWYTVINGKVVVDKGHVKGVDLVKLTKKVNQLSKELLQKCGVSSKL